MSQLNGWRLSRFNVEKPEEAETLSVLVQPVYSDSVHWGCFSVAAVTLQFRLLLSYVTPHACSLCAQCAQFLLQKVILAFES